MWKISSQPIWKNCNSKIFKVQTKISAWKFNKQDISTSHNFLSKILGYWGQTIRGNWRSLHLKKVAFSLHPGLTDSPGKMMVGRRSFPIGRSYVTLRFGKIDWNKNPKKSSGHGGLIVMWVAMGFESVQEITNETNPGSLQDPIRIALLGNTGPPFRGKLPFLGEKNACSSSFLRKIWSTPWEFKFKSGKTFFWMINNLKNNILYWNSYPKDPDMSQELDFPYIPIMGMGCFDH